MAAEGSAGETAAQKCLDELQRRGCDFSILFWLRHLQSMVDTDVGDDLNLFLKDMKLPISNFANQEFRRGFFEVVRLKFNVSGLGKVNPKNFVVEMNCGGKERSIKAAKESRWPRPYQPFCFQAWLA